MRVREESIKTILTFETRYKPPKGRDIRVFVVGTIPELGHCKIDDAKLTIRLEKSIRKAFREKLSAEVRRVFQGNLGKGFGAATESNDSSDGEEDADISMSEIERLETDKQAPIWERIEKKPLVAECLADFAVPMDEDPDNTGEANLWSSEPVTINSLRPGEKFSYLYFAWDLDDNRLWDIERFQEARFIALPKPQVDRKRGNSWVCRSTNMHQKGYVLKHKSYFDPSSEESNDDGGSDDDY
eukprot:Gregarina_sp_Pseudo_9__1357@NODE_1909_length_1262_cov_87_901881_g1770_i0_p1_GENE_NODE_1909_length_1262_cov_87_901881_g1770_i0NODE_1909_length_1262_cov_87_901881_g1770_i0_p1_ORF_typecomplete_len242_score11_47CBM_20/PF00686_19/1_2CBM_20/PF00686_19/0_56_NODE_1909_length_1262_cov_87_901881_g1770_i0186911